MKILTETELKDAKDHIIALDMMDDYEKLDYLIEMQLSGTDIEISVDNDAVHIFFGETSDEYIGTSFNDSGYYILPMLFQKLGFNADFV